MVAITYIAVITTIIHSVIFVSMCYFLANTIIIIERYCKSISTLFTGVKSHLMVCQNIDPIHFLSSLMSACASTEQANSLILLHETSQPCLQHFRPKYSTDPSNIPLLRHFPTRCVSAL